MFSNRSPSKNFLSTSDRLAEGLGLVDSDTKVRTSRRRRSYFATAVCLILTLTILLLLLWFMLLRGTREGHKDDFEPWPPRLVVQTSDPSAEAVAALPAQVAAVLLRHSKLSASGLEIMEFDGMDSLRVVARRLMKELGPGLKYLAQDYIVAPDTQMAQSITEQWKGVQLGVDGVGSHSRRLHQERSLQWHLEGADCMWNYTRGEGVTIAVMDTGCDLSHPDLLGSAWTNLREIPANGIDDDGNGFVDDVMGWNFGAGNADVSDADGHGTHVAAIAAGSGVSMVSGVAPRAKIMCLKVQDDDGQLFASYIFSAYQYALDMGAHIIVNSFSNTYWSVPQDPPGAKYYSRTAAYEDAARVLRDAGVLIFAAAGNEQVSNDDLEVSGYPNLPTNLNLDHIVAVAATGADQSRWSEGAPDGTSQVAGSNFGARTVDLGAPGVNIVSAQASTRSGKGVEGRTGTSMAAPFAAGFAALLLSHLASKDYKLHGRGPDVKSALTSVSALSGPLASTGVVHWGRDVAPNAVLDWNAACEYFGGEQPASPDFSFRGQSEDGPVFEDVESYLPRSAGRALASSMAVEFFDSAGDNTPQFYVSDLSPPPDYVRVVSRGIDFGPGLGGLEGVLAEGDPEYSRFRSDFAVRVEAVLDLPAGNTSIRISCPGTGGLFIGSELVAASPLAANMTGYIVQQEQASGLDVQAVCIFHDSKTFMLLESATHDSGNDTDPKFDVVAGNKLYRVIDIKEYGSERVFMSHTRGLGSSAELSSINAAGFGILLKAYKPVSPVNTAAVQWSDTQVEYLEVLDRGFPIQGASWGVLEAPVLAELSGILVFPNKGLYTLALSCDGWCNLSLYGSLLAESFSGDKSNANAVQFSALVDKPGPFPYRILYNQGSGILRIGLRWSLSGGTFQDVPPQRLFTDSYMENANSGTLLTGSISGLRMDFWTAGESVGLSKPLMTHRLDPGFNLTYSLQDLYPNISLGSEYAMQLHGYMALPNGTRSLHVAHAAGQATLHLGHCLFQVSDASGSGEAILSGGSNTILPSLVDGRLFHFQLTVTRVRANEMLSVLVGSSDSQKMDSMGPLMVSAGARADIRVRSPVHNPVYIGDAGALWMLYEPQENEFNSSITNALEDSARVSWVASLHSVDAGTALDHPLKFDSPSGTDQIIRFTGFYHAKDSGIQGLGLYCYEGDSIHVTLGGVTLVKAESCLPKVHDGVVFNIIPIYLPQGYYTFEYSIRTARSLAYLMAEVLPHSVAAQTQGLLSVASRSLYLPASLTPLVGDTERYTGEYSTNKTVAVVHL
eukprot:jgi/Ulvmu1/9281/UM050_0030.1